MWICRFISLSLLVSIFVFNSEDSVSAFDGIVKACQEEIENVSAYAMQLLISSGDRNVYIVVLL